MSEELETKFKNKRVRNADQDSVRSETIPNFLEQALISKQKYRDDLLKQVNEKRLRKIEEDKQNQEFYRTQQQAFEQERTGAVQDLYSRAALQRDELKRTLQQQIFEKESKKRQDDYEKKVEKELLDHNVAKFQESQSRWMQSMRSQRPGSAQKSKPDASNSSFQSDYDLDFVECEGCHKPMPPNALSQFSD